jgi:hypothetical protein
VKLGSMPDLGDNEDEGGGPHGDESPPATTTLGACQSSAKPGLDTRWQEVPLPSRPPHGLPQGSVGRQGKWRKELRAYARDGAIRRV